MSRRTAWLIGALLCCWLGIIAAGMAWRAPRWSVAVDIGNEGPFIAEGRTRSFQQFFGFLEPERASDGSNRTFRWSAGYSAITFTGAQRLQPLVLEFDLCGCRPGSAPLPVTIEINNQVIAQLNAPERWRHISIPVPQTLPHPEYGVMLLIRSPVVTTPEGRQVGAAVDSIRLRQLTRQPLTGSNGTLVALIVSAVLGWWRRRIGPMVGFTLLWITVAWLLYQPQLLPREEQLIIFSLGLLGLWWVGRRSLVAWPIGGVIAAWLTLSAQVLGHWVIDDAFISFRYAQNLVNGAGLVFNAGERVEGYTNFLWTLMMALALWLGQDPIIIASISTLILAFVIVSLTLVVGEALAGPTWAWVAALLVALSSPFLLYTSRGSGMETALFTALLLLVLFLVQHQRIGWAGSLTALTMMTRPDGLILAVVVGIVCIVTPFDEKNRQQPPKGGTTRMGVVRYLLPILLIFGPYFAWRWSYYGYPLPNTFYVKVGGTQAQLVRGLAYLWAFGRDYLLLIAGALGALLGLLLRREALKPGVRLLVGWSLVFCLYIAVVGGDWMPGARFGVPLIPPLAILCAWGLATLAERSRASALLLATGLLCLLALRLPDDSGYDPRTSVWREVDMVTKQREVGRWLALNTPPDTLIVAAAAGALPYYAQRPTIDAFGLNDTYIAHLPSTNLGTGKPGHEKSDPAYVMRRRPAIIPWSAAPVVFDHPRFSQDYEVRWYLGPEGAGLGMFVRKQ